MVEIIAAANLHKGYKRFDAVFNGISFRSCDHVSDSR